MPNATWAEKRRFERVPLSLHVAYTDSEEYLTDWTENVSGGGLFVRTSRHLNLGDEVELSVSFPGLVAPVTVKARVVRVQPGAQGAEAGIGMEVVNESARRSLADLALQATTKSQPDRTFRVLLAEDNQQAVEQYKRVFQRVNEVTADKLTLTIESNGHAAHERIKADGTDLLIADVFMPVMDGLKLLKALRGSADTSNLPVIIITGGGDEDVAEAVRMGANAVLKKPIRFADLLETATRLL